MTIAVGLDLASVDQVAASLRGPHRQRYLARIYTEGELADCLTANGLDPERLAARFAAKEATLKALSIGDAAIPLRAIEVVCDSSGTMRLRLHGRAAATAAAAGLVDLAVSLTHDSRLAAAVVVARATKD